LKNLGVKIGFFLAFAQRNFKNSERRVKSEFGIFLINRWLEIVWDLTIAYSIPEEETPEAQNSNNWRKEVEDWSFHAKWQK